MSTTSEGYEKEERIRSLCIKKGWFTCGSTRQYEKMFNIVREGGCIHDIALIIWLCSDDVSYVEVELEVRKALKI